MQKKILLVVLLGIANLAGAQIEEYPQSHIGEMPSDTSEIEITSQELFSIAMFAWIKCYYGTYYEYPKDIDSVFFLDLDNVCSQYMLDDYRLFFWKHRQQISVVASDTSWMMFYEGDTLCGYIYSLKPEDFSNEGAFHYSISAFSKSGKSFNIDSLRREEYRMILYQTLIDCYENYGYNFTLPTKEQMINHGYKWEKSPIYVLFQYDKSSGLQVHHICESIYTLEHNQYISLIERFADLLCAKWSVYKIIFAAPLMSKND